MDTNVTLDATVTVEPKKNGRQPPATEPVASPQAPQEETAPVAAASEAKPKPERIPVDGIRPYDVAVMKDKVEKCTWYRPETIKENSRYYMYIDVGNDPRGVAIVIGLTEEGKWAVCCSDRQNHPWYPPGEFRDLVLPTIYGVQNRKSAETILTQMEKSGGPEEESVVQ